MKKEICERFVVLPPSQCEKENRRIIIEISLQDLHTPARKSVQTTCQQASTMWEGKIKLNERRWPGLVKTTLEYILIQIKFAHIINYLIITPNIQYQDRAELPRKCGAQASLQYQKKA